MTNEEPEQAVELILRNLFKAETWNLSSTSVRNSDLRAILTERAELLAAVERMRGALIFYADQPPVYPPSFGPWGVGSTDFGHRARAALTTATEQGERG